MLTSKFILLHASLSNKVFGIRDKSSKKTLLVAIEINNNKTPVTIILMPFRLINIKPMRINNKISVQLKLKSNSARILYLCLVSIKRDNVKNNANATLTFLLFFMINPFHISLFFFSSSHPVICGYGLFRITVRGFALRGFQGFNVSKVTKTFKQLDDFLKLKCPRCAKPLLATASFNK